MTAKSTFWSKQKSHKTNETMICTRCNSIEIKQTSTIGMIFVGFVILMFIPAVRVFGFIGFGVFTVLVLSGYRPVMRDCLKCKAKGDKIVPVSDVKGKMLFDQRSAARAKLEETKNCEETYHADKVAEVENGASSENVKRKMDMFNKCVLSVIIGFILLIVGSIVYYNVDKRLHPEEFAMKEKTRAEQQEAKEREEKAKEDEARREQQRLVDEERKANYKAQIVSYNHEKETGIMFHDSAFSFDSLWSLNNDICRRVFTELQERINEIQYETVNIHIVVKNMSLHDSYGNSWQEDKKVAIFGFNRSDIEKFQCDNFPDVLNHAVVAKILIGNFEQDLVNECMKKIRKGDSFKTGLCRLL